MLIRLLARLEDDGDGREVLAFAPAAPAAPSTADRLSQSIRWTDAISLSEALNGPSRVAPAASRASAALEEAQCARVREAMIQAIAEDSAVKPRAGTPLDFSLFQRRLLAREQAMATSIGGLRQRLRATLAASSPAMSRLAAVDAAMEQVLEGRERKLIARLLPLLEKRFERLRQQAEPHSDPQPQPQPRPQHHHHQQQQQQAAAASRPAWLDAFRKDFHDALAAELDFRFQPIEGLLEALRTRPPQAVSA